MADSTTDNGNTLLRMLFTLVLAIGFFFLMAFVLMEGWNETLPKLLHSAHAQTYDPTLHFKPIEYTDAMIMLGVFIAAVVTAGVSMGFISDGLAALANAVRSATGQGTKAKKK